MKEGQFPINEFIILELQTQATEKPANPSRGGLVEVVVAVVVGLEERQVQVLLQVL